MKRVLNPRMATLSLMSLMLVGCHDEAEPQYMKCMAAEKAGDIGTALEACETAAYLSESPQQTLALKKLDDLRVKHRQWLTERMTQATFTEAWCMGLVEHLTPEYIGSLAADQAVKAPSSRISRDVIASAVHDNLQNLVVNCKEDAFEKQNVEHWKCVWRSGPDGSKKCPKDK